MVFNFRTPSFFYDSPVEEDTEVLREFSFEELKAATRNFSHDNLLMRVAAGEVFKGRLQDGSFIVIKRLHKEWGRYVEEDFQRELEVRSLKIQHPNILSFRGYCKTKEENLLVYPLMIIGTLECYLGPTRRSGVQPLSWAARKQIALGVARGFAYLHHYCDPKIIYGDLSTWTILLDQEFEAVIGDFGLAKIMHQKDLIHGTIECPVFNDVDIEDDGNDQPTLSSGARWKHFLYVDTYVPTAVHGRSGFLAPEYACTGKCTLKSDVFAFGNTLLNLITGRSRFVIDHSDEERELMPDILEQSVDQDLQGNYVYEEAKKLVVLALQCSHFDPRQRPEMLEVVRVIEDLEEAPELRSSNPSSLATLGRSESKSTLFYSFSSSATIEDAS